MRRDQRRHHAQKNGGSQPDAERDCPVPAWISRNSVRPALTSCRWRIFFAANWLMLSKHGLLGLHSGKLRNGALYTGMTDDLVKRVWQHRNGVTPGFTRRYGVKMLVWFELH